MAELIAQEWRRDRYPMIWLAAIVFIAVVALAASTVLGTTTAPSEAMTELPFDANFAP